MSLPRKRHILHLAVWMIAGLGGLWMWSGYPNNPAESTVIPLSVTSPARTDEVYIPGPKAGEPATAHTQMPGKVLDLDKAEKHVSVVSLPITLNKPAEARRLPQWRRNAVPAAAARGRPLIAVIMDDAGVNRRNTEKAVTLEAPLTISFLPYAPELEPLVRQARANGHEIMVHLPMEPLGSNENPGPHALWVSENKAQIIKTVDWNLSRFDGYVGVNNHMGSRFSADRPDMRTVLKELKRRGLLFLNSRTTAKTVGADVARNLDVPYAERDVFLDDNPDPVAIRKQLATLERVARDKGQAVAIGHPYDTTIAVLRQWLAKAPSQGFELVPISRIVERNVRQRAYAEAKAKVVAR